MRVVPIHTTTNSDTGTIGPADRHRERTAIDVPESDDQAMMRSAHAIVRGFERGDICGDLLVRELRIKAFRFFVIGPLRRAVRRLTSRLHG